MMVDNEQADKHTCQCASHCITGALLSALCDAVEHVRTALAYVWHDMDMSSGMDELVEGEVYDAKACIETARGHGGKNQGVGCQDNVPATEPPNNTKCRECGGDAAHERHDTFGSNYIDVYWCDFCGIAWCGEYHLDRDTPPEEDGAEPPHSTYWNPYQYIPTVKCPPHLHIGMRVRISDASDMPQDHYRGKRGTIRGINTDVHSVWPYLVHLDGLWSCYFSGWELEPIADTEPEPTSPKYNLRDLVLITKSDHYTVWDHVGKTGIITRIEPVDVDRRYHVKLRDGTIFCNADEIELVEDGRSTVSNVTFLQSDDPRCSRPMDQSDAQNLCGGGTDNTGEVTPLMQMLDQSKQIESMCNILSGFEARLQKLNEQILACHTRCDQNHDDILDVGGDKLRKIIRGEIGSLKRSSTGGKDSEYQDSTCGRVRVQFKGEDE